MYEGKELTENSLFVRMRPNFVLLYGLGIAYEVMRMTYLFKNVALLLRSLQAKAFCTTLVSTDCGEQSCLLDDCSEINWQSGLLSSLLHLLRRTSAFFPPISPQLDNAGLAGRASSKSNIGELRVQLSLSSPLDMLLLKRRIAIWLTESPP